MIIRSLREIFGEPAGGVPSLVRALALKAGQHLPPTLAHMIGPELPKDHASAPGPSQIPRPHDGLASNSGER